MPIGTSKIGVLGGLAPGGTETFNTSGTFSVPPGITKVSITGSGSSGNPGNCGNAGNPGNNGTGGAGGGGGAGNGPNSGNPPSFFATRLGAAGRTGGGSYNRGDSCLQFSNNLINFCPTPYWRKGGRAGINNCLNPTPGFPFPNPAFMSTILNTNPVGGINARAPGESGPSGASGSSGSAGSTGSAGNPGCASSGLGNTFPGGAGGNAGAAGNAGTGGSGGGGGGGGIGSSTCGGASGGSGGTGGGSGGSGTQMSGIGFTVTPTGIIGGPGGSGGGGAGATNSGNSGVGGSGPYSINQGCPRSYHQRGGTSNCFCVGFTTSPNPNDSKYNYISGGPSVSGGAGGRGGTHGSSQYGIAPMINFYGCSINVLRPPFSIPNANPAIRSGGGGGSGGNGIAPQNNPCHLAQKGSGGGAGGGGRGNAGNAGGCGGAGGAGAAATPVTYNCVPVTPGSSYPITVASPGGQIVITWNPQ